MRNVTEPQIKLGQLGIPEIEFDLQSRDEIPRLLMGLQYIYCNRKIRREVFRILKKIIRPGTSMNNGRPGMDLWKILVLGTLRLNCNWDYDKVKEMADHHDTLRQILGHGLEDMGYRYPLQTIRDNIALFTPEILEEINQVVVKAGHSVLGVEGEKIKARCDSVVVETDVHFPTDINLLLDAMRKIITFAARLSEWMGLMVWRQSQHIMKKMKELYRTAQQLQRKKKRSKKKSVKMEKAVVEAHREYIKAAEEYVERARQTVETVRQVGGVVENIIADEIERYIAHAERQIDQTRRRVLEGEKIPHEEKVFSIFEEHTEWINKGKAGVPQELGVMVCLVEDQHGFILHHMVMQNTEDKEVAVPIIEQTKERYETLSSCSFDKGFWTPENKARLEELLDTVALRKKGKLTEAERLERSDAEYVEAYRQHPAIESAINALENHGLDRCLDHGIKGFRRYVALAVLARNIQQLGNILFEINKKKLEQQQGEQYRRAS